MKTGAGALAGAWSGAANARPKAFTGAWPGTANVRSGALAGAWSATSAWDRTATEPPGNPIDLGMRDSNLSVIQLTVAVYVDQAHQLHNALDLDGKSTPVLPRRSIWPRTPVCGRAT